MSAYGQMLDDGPGPLPASDRPPIDLVHLTRMTFGERNLEREVLLLFVRQAEKLLIPLRTADSPMVATLAHTLKGSARGIGAWRAAQAAEAVEESASDGEARRSEAVQELEAAIQEASAFIGELLTSS